MEIIIPMDGNDGTEKDAFNLIGIDNGMFWLQGHATRAQLQALHAEITEALEGK